MSLDPVFVKQLTVLQDQVFKTALAGASNVYYVRPWMIPSFSVPTTTKINGVPAVIDVVDADKPANLFDVPKLGSPYTRKLLNLAYPSHFQNDGKVADIMACRLQADHLSSQERAFRLRHATAVRGRTHSEGRRRVQPGPVGVLNRVAVQVESLLNSREPDGV